MPIKLYTKLQPYNTNLKKEKYAYHGKQKENCNRKA